MTQQYIGIKAVMAWPSDGKDGSPGYAVKYPDGYISWSPREAFESAYVPVDPRYDVRVSIDVVKD